MSGVSDEAAIAAAEQETRRDGVRAAPYRALFELHTKRRDWDAAWCAAAVLVQLGAASDDERSTYERFAPREACPVRAPIDELSAILHDDEKGPIAARGRLDWVRRDEVTLAYEHGWVERLFGLNENERDYFNPEPPTLEAERLYVAAKGILYERGKAKSADRAALVASGSFAAIGKANAGNFGPAAAPEALFPFAVSRVHAEIRRHLGRTIDARRARTIEEMRFYASLYPCKRCGGPPRERDLIYSAGPDFTTLGGPCAFCGTPVTFAFFVEGDPAKVKPRPHELGPDERRSEIVLRAMLQEEDARCLKVLGSVTKDSELGPGAWHERVRAIDRAIICCGEIAKAGAKADYQLGLRDRWLARAREVATAWPRIAELEGRRLSLREEIAGLLAQITRDRLPAAADLRAYFAGRYVRSVAAQAGGEIVVVLAASDVTAVRLWDDASGTHALFAVGKGTKEDVGELERVVEGHRVQLGVVTLDDGALTRVSIHFALKQVATTPIGPMLAKLFDAAGPPAGVGALAAALGVTLEPSVLTAGGMGAFSLTRIGAGATVSSLSGKYGWDIYHEEPLRSLERLSGRELYEWTAGFDTGIGEVEAALRARFGAPVETEKGLVFGSFVVSRSAPFTLSWHRTLPDAALPKPDRAARESALRELARVLETTADVAAVTRAAAAMAPGLGITHESNGEGRVTLRFAPAIRAGELARIFGWREAVGQTFAFHQNVWEVRVVTGRNEYGPIAEVPLLGVWSLTAGLVARPTGGKWGGPEAPPGPLGGTYLLGPEDFVRHVEIARDLKRGHVKTLV